MQNLVHIRDKIVSFKTPITLVLSFTCCYMHIIQINQTFPLKSAPGNWIIGVTLTFIVCCIQDSYSTDEPSSSTEWQIMLSQSDPEENIIGTYVLTTD
jgi:hypothetical protein